MWIIHDVFFCVLLIFFFLPAFETLRRKHHRDSELSDANMELERTRSMLRETEAQRQKKEREIEEDHRKEYVPTSLIVVTV